MYNTSIQIKFETTMLKSNLCDYSDPYTCEWNYNKYWRWGSVPKMPVAAKTQKQQIQTTNAKDDETNKSVILKNCVPFTKFKIMLNTLM